MECHKCLFGKKIASGAAAGLRYEDTPCASCRLDGLPDLRTVPYNDALGVPEPAAEEPPAPEYLPLDVLSGAVRVLMGLDSKTLLAVRYRFFGWTSAQIARKLKISEDAVNGRIARAIKQSPVLMKLLPRSRVRMPLAKRPPKAAAGNSSSAA